MNINCLRTFVCVVEAGSFSRAARQLGLTQPAVSMQIQALEDYFGAKLIDRHGRHQELTKAGEQAMSRIALLVETLDETRRGIAELSTEVAGTVLVGASTVPGEQLCPVLFGQLVERFPRIRPRLIIDNTAAIVERLERRELDIALVGAPPKNATFRCEPVFTDEIVLLLHPTNPLAESVRVSPEALYEQSFVGRLAGSGSRSVYERELGSAGIVVNRFNTVLEVGSAVAAVNAVEAGVGVALVSVYAAEKALRDRAVVARRFKGLLLQRPFFLVTDHRYSGRAVEETAAMLRSPQARQMVEGRRRLWQLD